MPSTAALFAGAVAELETGFRDIEPELRGMAGEQLAGREDRWVFQWRQGLIAEELLAAATDIRAARGGALSVTPVGATRSTMTAPRRPRADRGTRGAQLGQGRYRGAVGSCFRLM